MNNQTLDEILYDLIVSQSQTELELLSQMDQWNRTNLAENAKSIDTMLEKVVNTGLDMIQTFLTEQHEGKPLLYYYLKRSSLYNKATAINQMRAFHEQTDKDVSPFNAEWLEDQIRVVVTEVKELNNLLARYGLSDDVEEI